MRPRTVSDGIIRSRVAGIFIERHPAARVIIRPLKRDPSVGLRGWATATLTVNGVDYPSLRGEKMRGPVTLKGDITFTTANLNQPRGFGPPNDFALLQINTGGQTHQLAIERAELVRLEAALIGPNAARR